MWNRWSLTVQTSVAAARIFVTIWVRFLLVSLVGYFGEKMRAAGTLVWDARPQRLNAPPDRPSPATRR